MTDYATEMLTYSGASDFMDGNKSGNDYQYNENGALIMDRNKGITNIEYDLLGHPRRITFTTGNSIEYVYAADGRKLRVTHNEKKSGRTVSNVKDYNEMFVFSNGYLSSVEFDGGFYDYDWIDYDYNLCFHVKDYLGNICQTVSDDCDFVYPVFQRKHYYPYGGLIGGISNAIGGKSFCSKELDHSYGLDLYDFEARMYDGLVPTFDRPDQLAGDYTWLSPYAYCAGNPVNCVDPDGRKIEFNASQNRNGVLSDSFNKAREYLQTINASEYLDRLVEDQNFFVMICLPTSIGKNGYNNRKEVYHQGNWNQGIIYWDPTIAVATDNGYIMSPVEGLNHEANHAINDLGGDEKQHMEHKEKTRPIPGDPWHSAEEKEVCNNENTLARKMGKLNSEHPTTRTQYKVDDVKLYRVNSVMSSITTNPILK